MRHERERLAEQRPRLHAGRLDPREPQPASAGRALAVEAKPGRDVAARERELGVRRPAEGDRRRRGSRARRSRRARSSSALGVREAAPRRSAQSTSSARSWTTSSIGPQPLHHRQRGAGVLLGRRAVAEVHRQVGEAGVEDRRRPRPFVVRGRAPARPTAAATAPSRVAGVLARVGEPLTRRHRDVRGRDRSRAARAGTGTPPDPPGRTRAASRPSRSAAHRRRPGRAAPAARGSARCCRPIGGHRVGQRHRQRGRARCPRAPAAAASRAPRRRPRP